MSSELEGITEAQQHLQEHLQENADELRSVLTHQQAEDVKERTWLNKVALSTAILATFAAIAAMQGNSLANEAMMNQLKANDQWSLFQARATKRHVDQSSVILLQALQKPVLPAMTSEIHKLTQEQATDQAEAKRLEEESKKSFAHHEFFAYCVAALQIAISLSAMAALLRKRSIWYLSLALGAVGLVLIAFGFL